MIRSFRPRSRSPVALAVAACVVLAMISAAVLPTVPSYDPWSWIVWGREVTDPHLSFVVSGGPSWKPLPFVFTTIWGLFGSAAPTLWVITARAGGLLGLVAALAAGQPAGAAAGAGAFAGLLAVVGVVLTQDWFYYWLRGTSEVVLIGATLWAIDRLLDGRKTQAFLLAVAAGLIRPEWWPFIGLYALWLWFRDPASRGWQMRLLILAGLVALPFLWFVPPWIGSGAPVPGRHPRRRVQRSPRLRPLPHRARRGAPTCRCCRRWSLAVVAVAIGWWRDRDRLLLAMGAGIAAWWVVVVAHDAGRLPRSGALLPACRGADLRARRRRRGAPGAARRRVAGAGRAALGAVAVAAAAVLVAVSIPFTTTRFAEARAAEPGRLAGRPIAQPARSGGRRRRRPPGRVPVPDELRRRQPLRPDRAGLEAARRRWSGSEPRCASQALTSSAPTTPPTARPRRSIRVSPGRDAGAGAGWRVVRLTDPRLPTTACVGR